MPKPSFKDYEEKQAAAGRTQGLAGQATCDKPFNQVDELIEQNKFLQQRLNNQDQELLSLYRRLSGQSW